jgi:hypothetical protein
MASIMLCEGGHDESVVGEVLLQWIASGESNVWCPACFEQALWAFVENLPTFDARVKGYMDAIMDKAAAKKSTTARRRRRAGQDEETGEPKDSADAGAEDTATDQ